MKVSGDVDGGRGCGGGTAYSPSDIVGLPTWVKAVDLSTKTQQRRPFHQISSTRPPWNSPMSLFSEFPLIHGREVDEMHKLMSYHGVEMSEGDGESLLDSGDEEGDTVHYDIFGNIISTRGSLETSLYASTEFYHDQFESPFPPPTTTPTTPNFAQKIPSTYADNDRTNDQEADGFDASGGPNQAYANVRECRYVSLKQTAILISRNFPNCSFGHRCKFRHPSTIQHPHLGS